MRIVSLADFAYRNRLLFSMKQTVRCGYEHIVYDLGDLGFGIKHTIPDSIARLDVTSRAHICLMKPSIMLDALNNTDETVVFLDADAFLVKPIDEIETDDYDVGVTYKGGERRTYINAGVLFFRQTPAARTFLHMWIERIKEVNEKLKVVDTRRIGDQIFLNELVFSHIQKGMLLGKIKDVGGVRVKFFDYSRYNQFSLARKSVVKPIPATTKIVHLRNTSEYRFNEVLSKWEL